MSQNILPILLLLLPIICGGIVAWINSAKTNDTTEKVEAWMRRRQGIISVKKGFFWKWTVHPPLRAIVKLCDWTDSLAHRGIKNGIRIATTLYVLAFWILLVVYAFMIVLAVIVAVIAGVIALAIMGQMLGDDNKSRRLNIPSFRSKTKGQTPDDDNVVEAAGQKGQKIYFGTSWLNEELKGRVDEQGNIYSGTSWLNEEKIGKIDKDGNIYRGTSWLNEELAGRIDSEGNIHKGTSWLNETKVGRIDEDGSVYKGSSWLNEKKTGRVGD